MDNGIALIAAIVASVIAVTVMWLALRRNLPPEAAEALAAYVAAIRHAAGDIVDEKTVILLAGAAWDKWGDGSKYFTREQFIAAVLRALNMEPQAAEYLAIYQRGLGR